MSIALITHYDLDAVTAAIVAKHTFPIAETKCQGYGKLRKNILALGDKGHSTLVMTDLACPLAEMELALSLFDKVIFFDHHEDSEQYIEMAKTNPKLEVHFSMKMSASAIIFQYALENDRLDISSNLTMQLSLLVMYTDVYDLWRTESPHWSKGYDLNTLFWAGNFWGFENRFKNGYTPLTSEEISKCTTQRAIRLDAIENAPQVELDTWFGREKNRAVIIAFENSDAIADVTLELDYDRYFIIYYTDGHLRLAVRARGRDDCVNVNNTLSYVAGQLPELIESAGGHALAGGITLKHNIPLDAAVKFFTEIVNPAFDETEIPF